MKEFIWILSQTERTGIALKINLCRIMMLIKRNVIWTIVANITPITLMNIIGHATFFIKPENIDIAITVLISTMLVLTPSKMR